MQLLVGRLVGVELRLLRIVRRARSWYGNIVYTLGGVAEILRVNRFVGDGGHLRVTRHRRTVLECFIYAQYCQDFESECWEKAQRG